MGGLQISPTRLLLGAIGLAGMLWGAWSLADDGTEALISVAIWLAGGVIIHDFVMAPITVGLTVVAARFLPAPARLPTVVAFIVWATCSVTFIAVLSGQGGKAGNDTILDRDYAVAWIVFTVVIAGAAVVASLTRSRRLGSR